MSQKKIYYIFSHFIVTEKLFKGIFCCNNKMRNYKMVPIWILRQNARIYDQVVFPQCKYHIFRALSRPRDNLCRIQALSRFVSNLAYLNLKQKLFNSCVSRFEKSQLNLNNLHSLEIVNRVSETQLQVSENGQHVALTSCSFIVGPTPLMLCQHLINTTWFLAARL